MRVEEVFFEILGGSGLFFADATWILVFHLDHHIGTFIFSTLSLMFTELPLEFKSFVANETFK